jgi:hypothetical protein
MQDPIILTSDSPILTTLNFRAYRNMAQRGVVPFLPLEDEPQIKEVYTPWGSKLTAKKGDMLVFELDRPEDKWPVDAGIFDETYLMIDPGYCVKKGITWMVPLIDITAGDADRPVEVHTLEGPEQVRAGDFFLAKGIRGEIWPYPISKANQIMRPIE